MCRERDMLLTMVAGGCGGSSKIEIDTKETYLDIDL